ncbi:uncharacterized protein METZ01_LOCUS238182, partial [marine metagenome]
MRRRRSIKIIATLGPATQSEQAVRELFQAGADAFRLNFSHGKREDHQVNIDCIRKIESEESRPIAILGDLQGPKIRIGRMAGGEAFLREGERFRLDLDEEPGTETRAPLLHPEVFDVLEEGANLLLNDGRIRLIVDKTGKDFVETLILTGGTLSNYKGVNVPNIVVPVSAITSRDRDNLEFALDKGVDWIALSFVQRPEDVEEANGLINGRAALMAKVEKPAALERIDEIIDLVDGVMVARGDLGVELPLEEVPGAQKQLILRARRAGKQVVVATQMLESMVTSPTPTRAEISDVATAVYDGADAVMLSAETAVGEFPTESVLVMNRVAEKVEVDPLFRRIIDAEHPSPDTTSEDAITASARQVAETISAAVIATYTTSGRTALRASRERPPVPILALTPRLKVARCLAIAWGLHCVETEDANTMREMVDR